jgi:hypothetical protein
MPANKSEVISTLREAQQEVEKVASSLPEAAWSKGVYESGWNARQLLCHLAESSGVASYLVGLAQAPAEGGGMPAGFDVDAWNGQRVAALQDKPLADLLNEARNNTDRNIAAVQAAPDDLMSKHIKAPWDIEGPLADVIIQSIQGHSAMHLADLRGAIT